MTEQSFDYWQQRASEVSIHYQAFIDGRYVDADSGRRFDCFSPIDGRLLAQVAECGSADVDRAVAAARAAFEKGSWSQAAPAERKACLLRLADLMEQHREELALLETLDMGKPIANALGDLAGAIGCIRWNAEAIDKLYDEIAPTGPGALAMVRREPLGVVAAIVPWNFPMLMSSWKLGPALATGNSVILKPSEKSPLSALLLASLAQQAGLPDGVLNVLPGFGADVGQALGLHMDIDGLAFTGSTAVGKLLMEMSGRSNLKRVFTECGGKSPNIVFADCPDLPAAARAAADAIFYNQGEVCVAGSRLLVEASIKDRFLPMVIEAGKAMQPGHPLDPATQMGAIVDQQQLERVMGYIRRGQEEGATLAMGGLQALQDSGGFYVEPTVFDHVGVDMSIAREEIFGPVLATISFDTEDEAIAIANDSPYGLAAALWTSQLGRAHRVAGKLRAGSVWVNCYNEGDMTMPFGGYKQSGNGRDKSLHALEKYTETKAIWIDLEASGR